MFEFLNEPVDYGSLIAILLGITVAREIMDWRKK